MTLTVAFVRKVPNRAGREELVFASDSRLTWGQNLDDGTKIFGLPRSDALMAFAGDTKYAYPLAHHISTSIAMYPRSADRRFPLTRAKGMILEVINQMHGRIHLLPTGQQHPHEADPHLEFLFGGYSWHEDRFRIWRIDFDQEKQKYTFRRCRKFFFIGTSAAVNEARARTMRFLQSQPPSAGFDMEPFDILRDIITEGFNPHVGGVPQVAKVYRYMSTQFFATLWGEPRIPHVFGRPLLPWETTAWPFFDPTSHEFHADAEEGKALSDDESEEDEGDLAEE